MIPKNAVTVTFDRAKEQVVAEYGESRRLSWWQAYHPGMSDWDMAYQMATKLMHEFEPIAFARISEDLYFALFDGLN